MASFETRYRPNTSRDTQRRARSETVLVMTSSNAKLTRKNQKSNPETGNPVLRCQTTKIGTLYHVHDVTGVKCGSDVVRRRVTVPRVIIQNKWRHAVARSRSIDVIRKHTEVKKLWRLGEVTAKWSESPPIRDTVVLLAKLRCYVSCIISFIALYRNVRKLQRQSEVYADQLDIINKSACVNIDINEAVLFDPSYYHAIRQMRLNTKSRNILSKEPDERTEEEIKYVMVSLKSVPLVAEYPLKMQKMIASRARFSSYEGGRLLIKQDQAPCCFYVLLFGSVIICVVDKDALRARTKCYLNRGECFGELAIIERKLRQATVMSRTYCELLVIDKEAYEDIFLAGGEDNLYDPANNQFLHSISFLKDWPMEKLCLDPKIYLFHFFRRGSVIVKNSRNSKWLYIVRTGSVRVIKVLNKEKSKLSVNCLRDTPSKPFIALSSMNRISAKVKTWNNSFKRRPEISVTENRMGQHQGSSQSAKPNLTDKTSDSWLTGPCHISGDVPQEKKTLIDVLEDNTEDLTKKVIGLPVFVHIETLTKGQVFGLESMLHNDQPSLCLVSNGAECILINRQFYMKYCPPSVLSELRSQISPYPSDNMLQSSLKVKINWEAYKQQLMAELFGNKKTS